MTTPLLTLCDVKKSFPEVNNRELEVLKNINFGLNQGESVAIMGASGCGKSTLLNIIGTMDQPTEGTVLFQGQDMADWDETRRAKFRNSEVGIVFQDHHLLPQLNILQNVLLPCFSWTEKALVRAEHLLKAVHLDDRMHQFPAELSGGERQRVAVVRALMNRPKMILADEPTGSLDPGHAGKVADMLVSLASEEGVAIVTVTHSPDIARRMARRFKLEEGELKEAR